ncbi:glycosyl hydrolase family 35, partial [Bacteroides ovatus]
DFQAPLGEFGLEHPSYRYLRTIHSFLADFGSNLAPMETVLPEGWEKMTPENRDDLRYAARMKDDSGFIFMINFQDHDTLRHDMDGLQLQLNLRNETLRIPEQGTFTLPKDESMILPFNLMLGSARLRYATAQPLMKINDNSIDHYIFFAPEGMKPEYCFDARTVKGKAKYAVTSGLKSTITVTPRNGKKIKITTLNHEQALNAIKVDGQLLITTATVLPTAEGITLQQLGNNAFDYILYPSAKGWQSQTVQVQPVSPECRVEKITTRRITVAFSDTVHTPQVNEYFMKIDYTGDVAMAFLGGKMVQDEFWHAQPWMIGLNRHKEMMNKEAMSFYFRPLRSDATCLQDLPQSAIPDFKGNNQVLEIKNVEIIPQYQLRINN